MVVACETCADLRQTHRIGNARKLEQAFRVIQENIDDGTIVEVDRTNEFAPDTFDSIVKSDTRPDYIENHFKCTSCGCYFRLAVETYHGSGGTWEVNLDEGSIDV